MATDPSQIPRWREFQPTPVPAEESQHVPVVVVGAGPVGLTVALDLGQRGHDVMVLSRFPFIPGGSKAICFAKRTLDIWHRMGVADRMIEKGVVWNIGKVFRGDSTEPIYQFDMLPVKDQRNPGFINLQQYYAEEYLIEALAELPNVDLRFAHEMTSLDAQDNGVALTVAACNGEYRLEADWLIACDGHKSPSRKFLDLDFQGQVFEDNFLIADIRLAAERPAERWFWFDPPFNPGRSALLHKQPDDVWRLDFQLGPDADRERVVEPANVEPLIRGMLGQDIDFEPVWYSVYTFQCRRMDRFVHARVIFAGDSAHLVSPFGARGCNGGVADSENLCWKLDLILRGKATAKLLDSYEFEAGRTADVNIMNSTRSTDFMVPRSDCMRDFRDAVLDLAEDHAFARPFVNSGRLSIAVDYPDSPWVTPDTGAWQAGPAPGSPALDAPLGNGWLIDRLGDDFTLLGNAIVDEMSSQVKAIDVAERNGRATERLRERYDLTPGSAYLIRPDGYVAARWKNPSTDALGTALRRAMGVL